MIISIDTDRVASLKKEGDKIFFSAEGEAIIAELMQMGTMVSQAMDEVKKKLEETALKLDPNFVSIQGDQVKVSYRSYGAKYKIDPQYIAKLPKEFYTVKESYTANTKVIEVYVDEKGALPLGVDAPDRPKKISITSKGGDDEKSEE